MFGGCVVCVRNVGQNHILLSQLEWGFRHDKLRRVAFLASEGSFLEGLLYLDVEVSERVAVFRLDLAMVTQRSNLRARSGVLQTQVFVLVAQCHEVDSSFCSCKGLDA